mmetsp:Transcript_57736/g.141006  ORF Transcript_57736/g.141006 Transcript_57736/m.141006 type:complete len:378 (+) Transcript_57736:122-1255(+)
MSKSPSLRRIQADIRELSLDPSPNYHAAPLEDDMFEWHFTIRGATGTDFEGGVYHGRILLPPEYPFKPPHIMFLTPSGRFETNTKICLSFTAFHAELWQPAWGIRLILEALISFLPTPADGAIGALDWSSTERKRLAKRSVDFVCSKCCGGGCNKVIDLLPKMDPETAAKKSAAFAKEIAELQRLQQANEGGAGGGMSENKKIEEQSDDNGAGNETKHESNNVDDVNTGQKSQSVQTATSASIATDPLLRPPEEEVVFGVDDDDDDDSDDALEENNDSKNQAAAEKDDDSKIGEDQKATEQPPHREDAAGANMDDNLAFEHEVDNANNANGNNDDLTSLYDPLLNLMIILMAVICYLLVQKYMDLQAELLELQQQDL